MATAIASDHKLMRAMTSYIAIASCIAAVHGQTLDEAADVKRFLLARYGDTATRPSGEAGAADGVQVQMVIDRFHELDERSMTWGFEGYLRSWWLDPRLAFNHTSAAGRISKLVLTRQESQSIWRPAFYWEGAITTQLPGDKESFTSGRGHLLDVYPDGRVFHSMQVSMKLACDKFDLRKLPYDTQHCAFMMGSYEATAAEVRLRWAANAFAGWSTACIKNFVATSIDVSTPTLAYDVGEATDREYSFARVVVSFTRRAEFHVFSYLLPSIVMVFVSMLGCIRGDASSRRCVLAASASVSTRAVRIPRDSSDRSGRHAGARDSRHRHHPRGALQLHRAVRLAAAGRAARLAEQVHARASTAWREPRRLPGGRERPDRARSNRSCAFELAAGSGVDPLQPDGFRRTGGRGLRHPGDALAARA